MTDVEVHTTLSEIFAKDPLKMVRADHEAIIQELRAQRQRFNLGNKKAGTVKPQKLKIDPQAATAAAQISLKDLGL